MILKAGHKLSEQQIQALNKFLEREMLLGEVSISREVKGELVTT
jgi:F0F1-type ATP synthase delta subunit